MTVNAIPMAKQTKQEVVENDLSGSSLRSSQITSEIDFLKRMKLKKYISTVAGAGTSLKAIVDFESADDQRIQNVYAKLIKMYNEAEEEKKKAASDPATVRTARNTLSNLYAQFGYKSLYEIACVIAEIQRVKAENEDIMSTVKGLFT